MYADCQSILHTIVLTEVDAYALNCGHIVLNVRVAEVEMRRPLVQAMVSSVHVQVQHCMWSCIEEIFLKPTEQMLHTTVQVHT